MGSQFEVRATNRPFMGHYEESFQCNTLWVAMKQFRKYQKQGYEIINIDYRKSVKVDTSNWNDITMG